MVEGRGREAWNHTANILATLVNINRDPKKSAIKASGVNPYLQDGEGDDGIVIESMGDVKSAFVKEQK